MRKGLEQTLLQGRHTEGPETYEKMLSITSLSSVGEVQVETTMRYHLTPVTVANINKSTNVGEDAEKREP